MEVNSRHSYNFWILNPGDELFLHLEKWPATIPRMHKIRPGLNFVEVSLKEEFDYSQSCKDGDYKNYLGSNLNYLNMQFFKVIYILVSACAKDIFANNAKNASCKPFWLFTMDVLETQYFESAKQNTIVKISELYRSIQTAAGSVPRNCKRKYFYPP